MLYNKRFDPLSVPCPGRRRRSGTNQAIGHRCHSLAWAFDPASCVPQANATLGNDTDMKEYGDIRELRREGGNAGMEAAIEWIGFFQKQTK